MKDFVSDYTILIVDDIPTNVMLVQAILKKEGYSLLTASGGREALRIAQEKHPHLVLLDIMMPEMDGYEVLQHLKSNPETTSIPVIIMSALNDMPSIVKGYQLGAIEYVTKPFQREELVKRIAHRFELYSIERIKRELETTIESRDMLYSVVSHDLRSPLGTLKMMNHSILGMISREKAGDDAYEMLLMMNKTAEETFQLLDNLTKWSKSQQKKMLPHRQKTEINSIIDSIVALYQPIASLKHVKIISPDTSQPLSGRVDIDMVKTVVRNILSHALDYSQEDGEVYVSSRTEGDYWHFSVRYAGKERKEEEHDTDLGWKLIRIFTELHGGRFQSASNDGKGATLSVTLRINDPEE